MRAKAATLAVGTEVTDGQILDRNSGWISQRLVDAGIEVIEHRAVADDRADITRALKELSERVDLLFVTGGLGPTSDDFTRDLISSVFERPLEYDEGSWQHVVDLLTPRGIQPREVQKQQCWFPKGAHVLENPAGTANAFYLDVKIGTKPLKVYALPGPPSEIAVVWEKHLAADIEAMTPLENREHLTIYRCLGKGESDIAELVEEAIKGSGLRVGYRAHLPYIEVKLWIHDQAKAAPYLAKTQAALEQWIVNRDYEDATDSLFSTLNRGEHVEIIDAATGGILQERITAQIRETKQVETEFPLKIQTLWSKKAPADPSKGQFLKIEVGDDEKSWKVAFRTANGAQELEVRPAFQYKVTTERGRRFITEKALLLFSGQQEL